MATSGAKRSLRLAVGPNSRMLVAPSSNFPMMDWREFRFFNVLEDSMCSPVHREIKKILSAATVVDRRLECVTLAESFGWAGHSCPFQELSARGRRAVPGRIKKHRTAQFHLKPVPRLAARSGRGMLMKFILEIIVAPVC